MSNKNGDSRIVDISFDHIASDNNLTESVDNYTTSNDKKPAENGGESISECSSSCSDTLTSNNDAKNEKVSTSEQQNQYEQYEKLDLKSLSTIDHYLSLGPDRLKLELKQRGLKCGGTLTQRAERLWSVRDLSSYPKQLMAKQSKLTNV
ncbi:hypothetical protein GJ496_002432 [Pomphorhynchus laevis]|nr:hypothetical protein GJ496_002432 [Pomphorhynchus laevis]